jgi:hypothetical protein
MRLEQRNILQPVVVLFPGARGFQVHDHGDSRIDTRYIHGATGFQAHIKASITQGSQQRQAIGLSQRFATRNRHVVSPVAGYLLQNRLKRPFLPTGKGVLGITPHATLRAASQANEYRGSTHSSCFTLEGIKNFGQTEVHSIS